MTQAPLRVLQILRAPVGGLFRHVGDLTTELAARGFAIGIIADSGGGDAQTDARLATLAPHASLGIHRLPIPRVLGPADLTTPLKIRQLARGLGIDIVHGHGAKGGFAARLVRLAGGARAAFYTPHGGVLHYAPNSVAGRLFRGIERALLPYTDGLIFESAFARAAFTAGIAAPRGPAPVIHNGVTAAEFELVEPNPDASDFVFIGEFRSLKGIRYLLEALGPIVAPGGQPARLVMAGDGPEMAEFKGQIESLGLAARVELAGVRPAREMLARGRYLVVPSLAESLPYVVLEAAAAGRPVIATRVGGIAEIFGPTADSLVPPADAVALRQAMQAMLDAPDQAEAAARDRRDFVRAKFSVTVMVDQIEAFYREGLARRQRA